MPDAEDKTIHDNAGQAKTPQSAQVKDKRVLPEGVVPKQAQAYVIAGLALLILLAVLFSKNHARTAPKEAATPPVAVSNNANRQRIQALEENLSADQQQSERQQIQATQKTDAAASPTGFTAATNAAQPVGSASAVGPQSPVSPQCDPIAEAEKALAFKARFASNLVTPASVPVAPQAAVGSAAVNGNLSSQQNIAAPNAPATAPQQTVPQVAIGNRHPSEINIDAAHGRPYVIFAGTMIDTVLTNRLDSDFAGPVKAMVTNPVYSRDRQHVLIPAGTFILGNTQKVGATGQAPGQTRLTVTFHRMIMPDGYSVDLDQFHGLDQIGDTGLKGKVNHHYLRIFGVSIALGVIAGAAEATTSGGYTTSGSDMYRQGVASSLSQSSGDVLDRFINILPTITIREGHRIKAYLTQDMLLPAYENHDMPGVM